MSNMNRRNFITGVTTGLAGLSLGSNLNAAPATEKNKKEEELKIRKYNPLGKTGLKVSDVIFGSVRVFSANALSYAYDLGINTFDTAESYMQGKSEEFVGQALSKVRDKVTIITKHSHRGKFNKTAFLERFHKSLKRMKTDYVDIAYLHGLSDLEIFKNQELLATYEQLRKEGKLRFTGFSFHSNMAKILKDMDNPEILKFAQVILFTYNHMEGEALKPLVKNLRKKGVGTVAMKTLAGGKQRTLKPFVKGNVSYPQAAVSWVLSNRDIDCAVPTMGTFNHVEEYVGASGKVLTANGLALLKTYREQVENTYCRVGCTDCETSCQANVSVSDVMRYKMYFEDYGHEKQAMQDYAKLPDNNKALACASCSGSCNSACRYGLKVKENLLAAHKMLS